MCKICIYFLIYHQMKCEQTKVSSGSSGGDTGGGSDTGTLVLGTAFYWRNADWVDGWVNVREEPSKSSAAVGEEGETGLGYAWYYTFSGKWSTTQQREWLYHKYSSGIGGEGYVLAKYINGNLTFNATISGSGVNFRTLPSTSSEVITTLQRNERVTIIDTISGWYRITCPKGTGWVSSSYVTKD